MNAEPKLKKRQKELLARATEALDSHGAKPPPPKELAQELRVPIQAVFSILDIGTQCGHIVRLSNGFHFASKTLFRLAETARQDYAEREFSTAELRDLLDVSRETANAILEYWDKYGLTAKDGGKRRMKPSE